MPRKLEERSAQRRAQLQSWQQSPPEKPRSPWLSLLATAQLSLGLAAYVAVLGYIVNLGLLKQSTTVVPFKIVPLTYLSLGLNFIFIFVIVAIPYALLFLAVMYLFGLVIWGIQDRRLRPIYAFKTFVPFMWKLVTTETMAIIWMIALLFLSAFTPISLLQRFPTAQSTAPSARGIILIFKEPIDTTLWSLSVDPQNNRRTKRLNLIAELEDGLLVRDADTGVVVEVKDDAISGFIDNSSLQPTATPSPTPTATTGP